MLDDLLPLVKKPIRYTGGEYNITIKTDPFVNVGIIFPEIYELGMSNQGIKIIYHLLNQEPGVQCERIFAPWPDFSEQLKNSDTPLYGLETKRAITDFDILGFSLQSELCYTNVLYILELAKIPLCSADRNGNHPIIMAGGPATLNPTPLSSVIDAFVIGDGEEVVRQIAQILKGLPKEKRNERLLELSKLSGVWVPEIHGYDKPIRKCVIREFREDEIPSPPILPICDITHDRLVVEVMRGCTWGCRFCQAGYTNRPLRMRNEADILKAVERGIRQTGWEEVSLLSFSILDYPDLLNLIRKLNEILKKKMVSISLPAMRGELFSEDLGILLKDIKKTGLTFAPETASESLRYRLNKSFSNEQLIASINTAYRLGWRQVKLYFMVGLPFENDNDIIEINKLANDILKTCPKGNIKISVSPFVPKPHTPFESVEFALIEELTEKINLIKKMKKNRVEVKYQSPEVSFIEAVLSRADEKIFPVIESVYRKGAKFEEWREGFDFAKWQSAFEETGIDPRGYLKPKDKNPWDFIDIGINKDFLAEEFNRARLSITSENCYYGNCAKCGACDNQIKRELSQEKYLIYERSINSIKKKSHPIMYRVKYAVGESFRYASHLDITRTIYRALRRSDLPIKYTEGFSPIPKVSFCPPKSVGQISKGDFFDFFLDEEYFGNISRELNARFPPGIRILEIRSLPIKTPSLSSSINLIFYEVDINKDFINKSIDFRDNKPKYVKTKSGMKNVQGCLESLSLDNGPLICGLKFGEGKINVYDLVAYLTDLPVDQVKKFKVTRTTMFIKKEGILYSPMEVK